MRPEANIDNVLHVAQIATAMNMDRLREISYICVKRRLVSLRIRAVRSMKLCDKYNSYSSILFQWSVNWEI